MKTRLLAGLLGMFSLFASTVVLAHKSDSYGHRDYYGNVRPAYGSGYASHAYVNVPYYGHVHGPYCNHGPNYRYARGFDHRYGHHYKSHYKRHHYKPHHRRQHYNDYYGRGH